MPAEAGIQKALIFLVSRLRGNDDYVIIQSILSRITSLWFSAVCGVSEAAGISRVTGTA